MSDNISLEESESKRKRTSLIAILLAVLALGEGVKIFIDHQRIQTRDTELASSKEELDSTVSKLKTIRTELEQKIIEVQKLGGKVADLEKAKAQVEADLRNTRMVSGRNVTRLKEKLAGYEELLKLKDQEIETLKTVNERLFTENTSLKTTQNKLSDSIVQLARNTEKLSTKVALGSRLKAEDISVFALNKKGKEVSLPFRSKQIESIRVDFNIAENDVAPIEGKKIIIRIIDENERVIFDLANGSGTFIRDGKEQFYTAAQDILFNNTGQKISFTYQKGSKYEPGKYQVEAICDGYLMGSASFEVR